MSSKEVEVRGAGAYDSIDGLEDIDAADLVMPVYKMDHDNKCWVDSLTNQQFPVIRGIVLGVLKQRILWPADPGVAGETPICRAYDLETGYPDEDKFKVRLVRDTSGFTNEQIETGVLPCESCNLKEWGTHPKGDGPWCNEQYTTPILVLDDEGGITAAVISHQRTALKPLKGYITSFASRRKPFYTAVTTIGLTQMKKGTSEYVIPKFIIGEESDSDFWQDFSSRWAQTKAFLGSPRGRQPDAEPAQETPRQSAPAAAKPPAAPKPAPAPEPVESEPEVEQVEPEAVAVSEPVAPKRPAPAAAAPAPPPAPAADDDGDEVPF